MHIQPNKVVSKEIPHNDHAASTFTVSDINGLRKNIHKTRVLPPNPTNINEVHTLIDMEKKVTTIIQECCFYELMMKIKMY